MKIAIKQLENGKYLLKIKYDMFILGRNVLLSYTTIVLCFNCIYKTCLVTFLGLHTPKVI